CSVKIPFEWALQNRFEKIVVVRTRDRTYRPPKQDSSGIIHQMYGEFPEFEDVLLRMDEIYIRELEQVDRLHAEGRIFEIVPSIPIRIGRLERNLEKLGDVYWQGVHDAREQLPALREYLAAGH
ncbi:MAG: patatin family protein, partial [Clostridia bacterium]|nr:patatin family protein [Clostridia bacterium]